MKTFLIEDYGASPEKDINTSEIQAAIDACSNSGGGRVLCGPGCYITGTLELKSNVELHLSPGCELKASKNPDAYEELKAEGFCPDYVDEGCTTHLIRAVKAENISISGRGRINGSGLSFYSPEDIRVRRKPAGHRPRMVMFYDCRSIAIEEVSIADSPCWSVWLMKCQNVKIRGISISGNDNLINNDGIDIDSCRNVTVSDSSFRTEDDCIVLRSIRDAYEEPAACENVTVSNCLLESSCQGIRVGCPSDYIIRHCSFNNIVITNSQNGINIENPSRYVVENKRGGAYIHDIVFSNFLVECRKFPIRLFIEEDVEIERLSSVSFSGFRIKSGGPVLIHGGSMTKIQDISLSDMHIETSGEDSLTFKNCEGVKLANVNLSNKQPISEV